MAKPIHPTAFRSMAWAAFRERLRRYHELDAYDKLVRRLVKQGHSKPDARLVAAQEFRPDGEGPLEWEAWPGPFDELVPARVLANFVANARGPDHPFCDEGLAKFSRLQLPLRVIRKRRKEHRMARAEAARLRREAERLATQPEPQAHAKAAE